MEIERAKKSREEKEKTRIQNYEKKSIKGQTMTQKKMVQAKIDKREWENLTTNGELSRVWTDGACEGNGKMDAVAGWGVYFGDDNHFNKHTALEGPTQTNQRAELQAAIYALSVLSKRPPPGLHQFYTIATDSTYVIKGSTKDARWARQGWRKDDGSEVANVDPWKRMLVLVTLTRGLVKMEHVYGHSGDRGNDKADRFAVWGVLGRDMGEDTNGRNTSKEKGKAKVIELQRREQSDRYRQAEKEKTTKEMMLAKSTK